MAILKFQNGEIYYNTMVIPVSKNVITIYYENPDAGSTPNVSGFRIYKDKELKQCLDNGEYLKFTTLYRSGAYLWYELSNDGSVYDEKPESNLPDPPPPAGLTPKEKLINQLMTTEKLLSESDYKIIKAYEYSLVGKETDYDMEVLHQERQQLREEINDLREQLQALEENKQNKEE